MSVKDKVLHWFLKQDNQILSGQEIADTLGVSRNSVWKAVNQLKKEGHKIESVSNKGYLYVEPTKSLNSHLIEKGIEGVAPGSHIEIHDQVSSTNDLAKEYAAQGNKNLGLFISRTQTKGRGRRSKTFYSNLDHGLYFSIVDDVSEVTMQEIPTFTVKAAVAMAKAIEMQASQGVKIKWVNDLFMKGHKVGGILSELITSLEEMSPSQIVIGIGINLAGDFNQASSEVKEIAGTVYGETIPHHFNINQLLIDFIINFHQFKLAKGEAIKAYDQRILGKGKTVEYQINQATHCGKIIGINEMGHLLVENQEGRTQALLGQEISFSSRQFLNE